MSDMSLRERMEKPRKQKPLSWRTCPACKSRATKIFSLNTGKYQCQICEHEYAPPAADLLGVKEESNE